jgi:phospholipid/cholesterol/gamma-HCH transport system substrate-binding protein
VKKYTAIIIGVSFLLAIALFIWGFNFLKGRDIFNKETVYIGKYKEISGLTVSNPVMVNGLKTGLVNRIYFDPDLSGDIIVEFLVGNDFPIPKNTVARIFSSDLMGSKAVEFKLGNSTEYAQSGDTLQTALETSLMQEVNAQVQPIKMKAENLLSSIDSLVVVIQAILNENARKNLTASFDGLKNTMENLESATGNIDTLITSESRRISRILKNVDSLSLTLKNNRESFAAIITNFEKISDSLVVADIPGTFNRVNSSLDHLDSILLAIDRGEGTVGMLMHDDTLYIELTKSAEELNKLLEDIRLNPKRYVKFSLF